MEMKEKIERVTHIVDFPKSIADFEISHLTQLELYPGCKLFLDVQQYENNRRFSVCIVDFDDLEIKESTSFILQREDSYMDDILQLIRKYRNKLTLELWTAFEDVTFWEARNYYKDDPNYADDITLVSISKWEGFHAGCDIYSFWEWFSYNSDKQVP